MTAYYNEFDPKAAAWLRELIRAGHLPTGHVDERSIADVRPDDLRGFTQCHFFAGIGGWPYALRIAGWPDNKPVWTGSCPCQPFSAAGKGLGTADARHLWPVFFGLISADGPSIVFGEQVASAAGRLWLAGVRSDLEGVGYEVGAADLCAASVGSPNIRQRLFWMAHASGVGCEWRKNPGKSIGENTFQRREGLSDACGRSVPCGLGNAADQGPQGRNERGNGSSQWTPWAASVVLPCTDGKARRIEPGSFPLAHGVSGRVGLLRGYGNAINPWLAAEFIQACQEALT